MNSLNSVATNTLLSLTPEQRAVLAALATEAVPEGGLLRTLWRAALAPRQWWRVLLYLIGGSWLAQRLLRSESDAARTVVEGLLRHVVQPIIQVPLRLLGLPTMGSEIVERFLAESVAVRKSRETASTHSLPLLIAAFNLHRRLRQILDEGHAYRERERAGAAAKDPTRQTTHSKAKYELLFLFGEFLAWQEELRRFVHRSTDSRYMREVRAFSDAFSDTLVRDSDPVLDDEVFGGKAELSSTVDADVFHRTEASRHGLSAVWEKLSYFAQMTTQFICRTAGKLTARSTQGPDSGLGSSFTHTAGEEWVEFWLAGVDPRLGPLPVIYRSRAEAVSRQHAAGLEVVKQLGRNDVVYIWRGVLADGTMKFVRDTDSLQREADGTLVYDARSGLPLEVDPVTTVHRPAPVLWLAAAASVHTTPSKRRPGAKAAGTIAAAVVTDDDIEKASRNGGTHEKNPTASSFQQPIPDGAALQSVEAVSAQSVSRGSVTSVLRDEVTLEDRAPAPIASSEEDGQTRQANGCVPGSPHLSPKVDVEEAYGGDYRLSPMELRLMGEVMLRDINPRTSDPNTQAFSYSARWEQHFQANILSYSEFVQSFSALRQMRGVEHRDWQQYFEDSKESQGSAATTVSSLGAKPFAQAFFGLAELYERLSTCNPDSSITASPEKGSEKGSEREPEITSSTTEIIRRVRMVERALLRLIVSLDTKRELFPEAHVYAEQREQREKRAAFHRLLPSLFYNAARVIPAAVSSPP